MLCCEHDKVRPDVILLGKALSGGGLYISSLLLFNELTWLQYILSLLCLRIAILCYVSSLVNMAVHMAGMCRTNYSCAQFFMYL